MNPLSEYQQLLTRRNFFGHSGLRLGGMALTYLLGCDLAGPPRPVAVHPPLPGLPHFAPQSQIASSICT